MGLLIRWIRERHGATAIEYGLLLAGIALAILVSVTLLGDNLYNFFYEDLPAAIGE